MHCVEKKYQNFINLKKMLFMLHTETFNSMFKEKYDWETLCTASRDGLKKLNSDIPSDEIDYINKEMMDLEPRRQNYELSTASVKWEDFSDENNDKF